MRIIGGVAKIENLDIDSFTKYVEIKVKEDKEYIRISRLFNTKLIQEDYEN